MLNHAAQPRSLFENRIFNFQLLTFDFFPFLVSNYSRYRFINQLF